MYMPKASTEVHLSVDGRPKGSRVSCKCMKASHVMRKLSIHLVWLARVCCIHWAPDSLGMGQGGFTSGICCDKEDNCCLRQGHSARSITGSVAVRRLIRAAHYATCKWAQISKMLMHILGTKHLLISEHVKLPELGSWHDHLRQIYVRNEQQKSDPCIRSYNAHSTTHIFYSKHETMTCT